MNARPWLRWTLSALLVVAAAWLLWRSLRGLDPTQLRLALASLPAGAIAGSIAATAVSFLCLAGYEQIATQWIAPGRVRPGVAWRTGLIAHALANTFGFHPVTAMALRLDRYRAHGIDATTLAKIVAVIGACVASGVLAILGLAGAWWLWQAQRLAMPVLLAAVAVLAALSLFSRVPSSAPRSRRLPMALLVLLLGLLEMGAALLAFTVLVPAGALPEGPALILLFVGATVLGVASHAPGGIGVFEATILAAAAPGARAPVLAALLAYRITYGLLPCALALLALGGGLLRGRFSSTAGTRA